MSLYFTIFIPPVIFYNIFKPMSIGISHNRSVSASSAGGSGVPAGQVNRARLCRGTLIPAPTSTHIFAAIGLCRAKPFGLQKYRQPERCMTFFVWFTNNCFLFQQLF
jgi:hypothetical protein